MKRRKRRQDTLILVITCILLLEEVNICFADACKASKPTQRTVSACPKTPEELQTAKEEKDCGSIAKLQNCSKSEDFVYHCLPSTTKDKLYEVCAPAIYSPGYCIGYDNLSQNIQVLYKDPCTASGCPKAFFSAAMLNYTYCQQLLRNMETNVISPPKSLARGGNHVASWVCNTGHDYGTVAIMTFCLLLLICIIGFAILWGKKFKNKCFNSRSTVVLDEEGNLGQEQRKKLMTTSTSGSSHCAMNTGFDRTSFEKALKEFHLHDLMKVFLDGGVDCIQTFLHQTEEGLQSLNLNKNQILKCKLAMPSIEQKYLKSDKSQHSKEQKKFTTI